jgi:lysophospholipid acyltransferase (LPLAT)-like uncharacterized protein
LCRFFLGRRKGNRFVNKKKPLVRMPSENFPVPLWYRAIVWLGTWIMSLVFRAILFTCRYDYFGFDAEVETHEKYPASSYATWHRNMLINMFHGRRRRSGIYNPACMASRSKDGAWAAGLLRRFGFVSPRGSGTNYGKEALAELVDLARRGYDCALTCDAPKGPAQRCKMGSIIIAARSGIPIVPSVGTAYPCWRIGTWDGTIIPKPFSRVVMAMDPDHILVPERADEAALEGYRNLVEERLNKLVYQVDYFALHPKEYASPFEVPLPADYLGEDWDPFRFSIARGEWKR